MNIIHNIVIAIINRKLVVINHITTNIIIGKNRKIIKFTITLKFKKKIKKYNLVVFFKFNILILDDSQIAWNTFLLFNTIAYLEYANNIFKIIQIVKTTINI